MRLRSRPMFFAACGALAVAAMLAASAFRSIFPTAAPSPRGVAAEPEIFATPLCGDERAALRWLGHVTGKMPPSEEIEWWGKPSDRQFGLFARRYNIAFAGYAAAAIGMRGDSSARKAAGAVLGNCVERMLRRDVWGYSQAKSYWGTKPWAPDPCYRENVMYTGHLLQLLALYECFTGDRKYSTDGFDFVWKKGKRVHYDVKRLIDVTVEQMRENASGGINCEPGLMFFPCNNHPHVALAMFSALGYGEWSAEAKRWERWALAHFFGPFFGGGAFNLVCHAKTGVMYPRGHGGLDAWSLLWYEPWASDRRQVVALWKECAKRIDWDWLGSDPDGLKPYANCLDPANVPPVVCVSFLAAAARACGDRGRAERFERIADRSLARRGGMYYLDVGREWRIGASANRIIALALANGSSFRAFLRCGFR